MPEKRVTVRVVRPEEGFNDPVMVEVLGAQSLDSFQGKAPPSRFEAATAEECLRQLGAALDVEARPPE